MGHTRSLRLGFALAGCLSLFSTTQASAAALNLTAGDGTCSGGTLVNIGGTPYCSFAGALWTTTDRQSTGTGVIQSFVRLQAGNNPDESGMNTDARPLTQEENNSPQFTRDLLEGAVPVLNLGGTLYYEFLLDINQTNADPLLTLQGLELCYSATDDRTILAADVDCAGTDFYSLDGGGNNRVELNYALNSGSGSGDLFVYIPVPGNSLAGVADTSFIYLWSQFGPYPNDTNDGFEEWAIRSLTTPSGSPIPEPTSLLLLGGGLTGLSTYARRFRQRKAQKSA